MKRKNFMITDHFSYNDVTRSSWAEARHVSNTPDCLQMAALENICRRLGEPLVAKFGNIRLRSAFRTALVNEGEHDVGCSRHLTGEAFDIVLPSVDMGRAYYRFILSHVDYDQVYFEYNRRGDMWLHCSVCLDPRTNRRQSFPNYRVLL